MTIKRHTYTVTADIGVVYDGPMHREAIAVYTSYATQESEVSLCVDGTPVDPGELL